MQAWVITMWSAVNPGTHYFNAELERYKESVASTLHAAAEVSRNRSGIAEHVTVNPKAIETLDALSIYDKSSIESSITQMQRHQHQPTSANSNTKTDGTQILNLAGDIRSNSHSHGSNHDHSNPNHSYISNQHQPD